MSLVMVIQFSSFLIAVLILVSSPGDYPPVPDIGAVGGQDQGEPEPRGPGGQQIPGGEDHGTLFLPVHIPGQNYGQIRADMLQNGGYLLSSEIVDRHRKSGIGQVTSPGRIPARG